MPDIVLPELARSLRSLGAQRDAASEAAHSAVFIPLLEARTRAGTGSLDKMLAALRGESLAGRIETLSIQAATLGVEDPALVRALTARTLELLEPLRESLHALDQRAAGARGDDAGWQAWVQQLRVVFSIADVACTALARLIGDRVSSARRSGGWFARGSP
jgi:hypothetical protein